VREFVIFGKFFLLSRSVIFPFGDPLTRITQTGFFRFGPDRPLKAVTCLIMLFFPTDSSWAFPPVPVESSLWSMSASYEQIALKVRRMCVSLAFFLHLYPTLHETECKSLASLTHPPLLREVTALRLDSPPGTIPSLAFSPAVFLYSTPSAPVID